MSLTLKKWLSRSDQLIMGGTARYSSAIWEIEEIPGLLISKIKYLDERTDGWGLGHIPAKPRLSLRIYNKLQPCRFATRREALQFVEGWLLANS